MSNAIVINNDYGYAVLDFSKVPPNAPLDFDTLTKIAINLTPQSSPPPNPSAGWVYLDDGTNTESGHKGLRYYNSSSWDDLLGYTTEEIQDIVSTLIQSGLGINGVYDDTSNEFTIHSLAYMLQNNTF